MALSRGIEPLRAGITLGASFIDTAESYGTEEVVGHAIRGIRKDIFLATKVSPKYFKPADVTAAADASLKRLNTDYVDFINSSCGADYPVLVHLEERRRSHTESQFARARQRKLRGL